MLSSKRGTLLKDLSPHLSGSLAKGVPAHREVSSNSCAPIPSPIPGPLETGAAPVFIVSKPRRSHPGMKESPVRLVPGSPFFTGARTAATEPASPKPAVDNANEISLAHSGYFRNSGCCLKQTGPFVSVAALSISSLRWSSIQASWSAKKSSWPESGQTCTSSLPI